MLFGLSQLHEEPVTILGRQSPIETSSTDCISNDEVDKGPLLGDNELEVIMEAELEHRRRSSEVATTDWKPSTTARQRKQTVFDSSSQRLQE